jgi:hypothetical protein
MDFYQVINNMLIYVQTNMLVAILAGLVLLLFLLRKPKLFLMIFFLAVIVFGAFYMITSISGVGSSQKRVLINKGH